MSGDQPALKVMWKDHEVTASVASVDVEDNDRLTDQATIVRCWHRRGVGS